MPRYAPYFAVLTVLLMVLGGCAALGLPTAESFGERVAAAYAANTAARQSATTLLQAKRISVEDAKNVLATTDALRAGIDAAAQISKTDPAAGNARLEAARTGLQALQSYLLTRQGAK